MLKYVCFLNYLGGNAKVIVNSIEQMEMGTVQQWVEQEAGAQQEGRILVQVQPSDVINVVVSHRKIWKNLETNFINKFLKELVLFGLYEILILLFLIL